MSDIYTDEDGDLVFDCQIHSDDDDVMDELNAEMKRIFADAMKNQTIIRDNTDKKKDTPARKVEGTIHVEGNLNVNGNGPVNVNGDVKVDGDYYNIHDNKYGV